MSAFPRIIASLEQTTTLSVGHYSLIVQEMSIHDWLTGARPFIVCSY
jgi:hypothetical protein